MDLCIQVEEKAKPSRCDRKETPFIVSLFHGSCDGNEPARKDKLTKTRQGNAFFPFSHQKAAWKSVIFTFKQTKTYFSRSLWKLICTSMLNSALKFTSHLPPCWSPHWMMWWQTWRSEITALSFGNCQKKSDFSPDGICNKPEVFQPSPTWLLFPLPSVTQLKSTSSALPRWSLSKGVLSLLWHEIKNYVNNTTYQDDIKK